MLCSVDFTSTTMECIQISQKLEFTLTDRLRGSLETPVAQLSFSQRYLKYEQVVGILGEIHLYQKTTDNYSS